MSTLLLSSVFSSKKIGARFQVKGEHTSPIKLEIDYNAPHGMTAFVGKTPKTFLSIVKCTNHLMRCRLCSELNTLMRTKMDENCKKMKKLRRSNLHDVHL